MSNQEASASGVKLDVRAYPIAEPKSSTVGFASMNINDIFAVQGIRVVKGENGLFAAMPSAKDAKGEYRDVCFPLNADLRKQINSAVLEAYNAALEKGPQEKASVTDKIKNGVKETPAAAKGKPAKNKSEPEV